MLKECWKCRSSSPVYLRLLHYIPKKFMVHLTASKIIFLTWSHNCMWFKYTLCEKCADCFKPINSRAVNFQFFGDSMTKQYIKIFATWKMNGKYLFYTTRSFKKYLFIFLITFFDGTKMMMKKLKNMKNCLLLLSVFKIIVKCGEEQIKNNNSREIFQLDVFKVQREIRGEFRCKLKIRFKERKE